MTGYWAHYRTHFKNIDEVVTDTFPVVGYTDAALIIDEDGSVKTVNALLEELREGGDEQEEGEGWTVSLSVSTSRRI